MASWLAYELDSGRSTSRVLLSAVSYDDMQAKSPTPSLEWLAARLKSLDFSDLQDSQVQGALERSVDSARYWQPPDGEDVLAGLPQVAQALSPVAEQFIASPRMQWCWQPRQVEQWAIEWRHADDPAPLPKNPERR